MTSAGAEMRVGWRPPQVKPAPTDEEIDQWRLRKRNYGMMTLLDWYSFQSGRPPLDTV